jgi:hypothetical protein
MAKLTVQVYQAGQDGSLAMINEVKPETSLGLIKLLYSGRCHYDLLLDDATADAILQAWPQAKIISLT